jgi:hypothetical protein
VNTVAAAAVPEIIELITPEFDKHAAAYVDAVAKAARGPHRRDVGRGRG